MHRSFVCTAPPGSGNSGAFSFSVFKAPLKARHCGVRFVVRPAGNNVEQQLGVVLMKNKRGEALEFLNINVKAHLQIIKIRTTKVITLFKI